MPFKTSEWSAIWEPKKPRAEQQRKPHHCNLCLQSFLYLSEHSGVRGHLGIVTLAAPTISTASSAVPAVTHSSSHSPRTFSGGPWALLPLQCPALTVMGWFAHPGEAAALAFPFTNTDAADGHGGPILLELGKTSEVASNLRGQRPHVARAPIDQGRAQTEWES